MKSLRTLIFTIICLLPFVVTGCGGKQPVAEVERPQVQQQIAVQEVAPMVHAQPLQLPVRFQRPGFFIPMDEEADGILGNWEEDFVVKVGAHITSTRGPQPLWDVLTRLATLRGMTVSWASDVDQRVLVNVNIRADDGFFEAIDNLLRQVDYFHEVEGNTIIVKYRTTRQFFIAIPFMRGTYTTTVGGNFGAAAGTEGTVKITSDANEFDVWSNITENLDIIFQQWATVAITPEPAGAVTPAEDGAEEVVAVATRRLAAGDSFYIIDRSIGMITVVAPLGIVERVESYLNSLRKELHRQVVIEARIVEVFLQDNSRIGLDWSGILYDFNLSGRLEFGTEGHVFPDLPGDFLSRIVINNQDFDIMINALNKQGDARVISSPKITVMNGQPAVISVGTDRSYIQSVETTVSEGVVSTSVEVGSVVEGISLGVLASIIDDDTVVLHLTPITTELVDDRIPEVRFGPNLVLGLPQIRVRQMSTMVKVNNGEMLIIGGLIDSVERSEDRFAPILGGLPIIRYLFGVEERVQEKRELVVLLTPRVI